MNRLNLCGMTLAFFVLISGGVGKAQLVQVGPGFVKAPFVRVYWCPDGSSRVLAPFVDVVSPGRRSMGWRPSAPLPASQDFAAMDWRELRASLHRLATNFDAELDRFRTGDLWKVELKTAEIRALTNGGQGAPTAEQRAELSTILERYDATRIKPEAGAISNLSSFQTIDAALREYATPPAVRLRRQLASADDDLNRSLDQMSTGKGWEDYLALPSRLADAPAKDAPTPTPAEIADLKAVLDRFESVSQNEKYRATSQLPAFRTTHDRLAEYLALLTNRPSGPAPSAEELPLPTPSKTQ